MQVVPEERTVWKFELTRHGLPMFTNSHIVMMPEGAKILHGGQINGDLFPLGGGEPKR